MSEVGPRDSLPDIRSWLRTFPMAALDRPDSSPPDPAVEPYVVFLDWLEHAAVSGIPEANVGVLATAGVGGGADARVLVLRDVTPNGWWFSGPVFSPKGLQLEADPFAALTFYWREHGRQVRIVGAARSGDAATTARDFRDRSPTARAVASASEQSEVLADEVEYRRAVDKAAAVIEGNSSFVPDHWRAWCLVATSVEFWQADPGRRHLRWRYSRADETRSWSQQTLWP
ncbi:pyridoxine/pyridoxamine 5'-phosphate oxidase [Antrihabitans cavernicola]|uniref:Pyridoxamine 5'-phosphate oxidase n=1 Tax=Antrihabitans cavernicola TaxID=2495913 RepID=A0A5A7SF97_9NOCA|nr:pyridoxamine 5'-phosphate oxidase family protein [Spelaeibacter cavernicola]KAA0023832.1 pyridoxamine 5'-phosphate oxidase [Spelaeibacter cavernicola]